MKSLLISLLLLSFSTHSTYDCTSSAPEMAGHHNMVLFGDPDDQLYSYHLPLFSGKVNGQTGHVLMHIYQSIWSIDLDKETKVAYKKKFDKEKTSQTPYPFFSLAPRGKKFKLPEMICNKDFSTDSLVVYGHVEKNPMFPTPEPLINNLSKVGTKENLFARRFNGTSPKELTYILFGTSKQKYLVHYLSDNENSFDQILAVSISKRSKKNLDDEVVMIKIQAEGSPIINLNNGTSGHNNRFKLSARPVGQKIQATLQEQPIELTIEGEVYFNQNGDLKIN